MKWFKRILFFILILLGLVSIGLVVTGNQHLFKAVANTYLVGRKGPSIEEHQIFKSREVAIARPQPWAVSANYNDAEPPADLLTAVEDYDPIAFLVIQNDSLLFERYWHGHDQHSQTNSFSMAKSLVSIAMGTALQQGHIGSINDKVIDYIPELKGTYKDELTIRHLLAMTSGMNFDESYGDPFGFMAKAYYGDELEKKTLDYEVALKPGNQWQYLGGNTILMSLILKRVTGQDLSSFFSESVWQKVGAEQPALWNIDQEGGIEKAYCCYYSNARDFARIGKLYLDSGRWNGEQIVPSPFWSESIVPASTNDGDIIPHYGLQWWLINYQGKEVFYARGILGQYVIAIPELDLIVVRLGHRRGDVNQEKHPADLYHYLDLAEWFVARN